MFTSIVVSAVEGMTELHKMERRERERERESVDFAGVRSLFRRVPGPFYNEKRRVATKGFVELRKITVLPSFVKSALDFQNKQYC